MTLHELRALTTHWRRFPPVHVSVAAIFGIGSSDAPVRQATNETVAELAAVAGPPLAKFQPRARMQ